jgi:hypothetical protein
MSEKYYHSWLDYCDELSEKLDALSKRLDLLQVAVLRADLRSQVSDSHLNDAVLEPYPLENRFYD